VLLPLLFCTFLSMMLLVAFKDCDIGIPVRFRTNGSIFILRRIQGHRRFAAMIRVLLYADDCAFVTHTLADAQHLLSHFLNAATRFGLTVRFNKTEVVLQSGDLVISTPLVIMAGEIALPTVV
jgi:hypothetical protein